MKSKSLVLTLVLMIAAWAQIATSNAPKQNSSETKSKCACCAKMASPDSKEAQACMRHTAKSANSKDKDTDSCCAERNGKSCCGNKAQSSMKSDKGKDCCDNSGKEKTGSCCAHSEQASSGTTDSGKCCCSAKNEKADSGCRTMMHS
jgi:hypothetical protein